MCVVIRVWLVGIVVRRYVYRFLHNITHPYSTLLALFCSSIPTSLLILKMSFRSFLFYCFFIS